ncbi:arginine n-methyltransferase 2 [Phaffia rhodozyma]|uniref:Arginine N-methyltransferase 2 n=1 Tax=Phaffia rhodozyma TaxID=264483 RepID=A0A0F7STU0_PHARH|nr:arginine n-methyltransferase 2 [Phaffia rhodozyma]
MSTEKEIDTPEARAALEAMDIQIAEAGTTLLQAAQTAGAAEVLRLLKEEEAPAWYQDELGWTAMHYAAEREDSDMVKALLANGGVWNAVDNQGYCSADIALSLNATKIYKLIQSHAVRSELLLSFLSSKGRTSASDSNLILKDGEEDTVAGNTDNFLKSKLTYEKDADGRERVVDEEGNGVMMGWEEGIMRASVDRLTEGLLEGRKEDEGLRILNVGFGLGIVDTMFQNLTPKPLLHTVIEPHPSVLAHMEETGWTEKERPNLMVLKGKWQDWVEKEEIYKEGGYDVIYFDTFSEGYSELKDFFQHLPNLLAGPESRFSFFHGLGATNATFHDVYTSLSELHLQEVGIGSVKWTDVLIEDEVREEVWNGIRRKYWTLPLYRLPIAQMDL